MLDESSFDFSGLGDERVEDGLDELAFALGGLRSNGQLVHKSSLWYAVECRDGIELGDLLRDPHRSQVSPDTRRLVSQIVDKLPEWDDTVSGVPDSVSIAGASSFVAFSVGYALHSTVRGHRVACLVFGAVERRGLVEVVADTMRRPVFFLAHHEHLALFWRSLFAAEDVTAARFFDLAWRAFPRLVLHPALKFAAFDGDYLLLRDAVVGLLGPLNDRSRR